MRSDGTVYASTTTPGPVAAISEGEQGLWCHCRVENKRRRASQRGGSAEQTFLLVPFDIIM